MSEFARMAKGAGKIRDIQSTALLSGFTLITAAVLISPMAGLLRLVFPAASVLVAIFLYLRNKPAFVGFTLWLSFLTPFVRRVVDYRAGYSPQSLILATPFLAAMVCTISVLRQPGILATRRGFPFLCCLGAVMYATVIGMVRYTPFEVGRALVSWLLPLAFGLFLFIEQEQIAEFRRTFEQCFLYGAIVMGGYGILQFFFLPPWDKYWMINVDMGPFGLAEAGSVRVFGTTNAPVVLASLMMASLVFLPAIKGKLRSIAAGAALIALLLTLSRSGWLGFAGAFAYLVFRTEGKRRTQIATMALCGIASVVLVIQVPFVHELLGQRFDTLSDVHHDVSYEARLDGHVKAFRDLMDKPYGEGLGAMESKEHATYEHDDSIGPHDSTILELLYSLGWCASAIYLLGIGALCRTLYSDRAASAYPAAALTVGILSQSMLNSIFPGLWGMLLWSAAALCLAGKKTESPAIASPKQDHSAGDVRVFVGAHQ